MSDEAIRGVQRWMALDLWMAVGLPSREFEEYIDSNGWADTWANLLGVVRGIGTVCATATGEDDWCVLREGHFGPHYGADDVGTPNDLVLRVFRARAAR